MDGELSQYDHVSQYKKRVKFNFPGLKAITIQKKLIRARHRQLPVSVGTDLRSFTRQVFKARCGLHQVLGVGQLVFTEILFVNGRHFSAN